MPQINPTLQQIIDRVDADIESRLDGTDPKLARNMTHVISRAISALSHGQYGYLTYIFKQLFISTADGENVDRWGETYQVTRKEASSAAGITVATGTDGSNILAGQLLQRADGIQYEVQTSTIISLGTANVEVQAVDEGNVTNTEAGSTITFQSPPPGVNSITTVDPIGLTGGADRESDADYAARILFRIQEPPQGGSRADYVRWALEVPGVTRAYAYPNEPTSCFVTVRFMMDNTYPDGIPMPGDVTRVADYINDPIRKPVAAKINVVAPIALPIAFDVNITIGDSPETRQNVELELRDMIFRDAVPSGFVDGVFQPGIIYLSRINEAISIAPGVFDHILNSPVANITPPTGEIATFGSVVFA